MEFQGKLRSAAHTNLRPLPRLSGVRNFPERAEVRETNGSKGVCVFFGAAPAGNFASFPN